MNRTLPENLIEIRQAMKEPELDGRTVNYDKIFIMHIYMYGWRDVCQVALSDAGNTCNTCFIVESLAAAKAVLASNLSGEEGG